MLTPVTSNATMSKDEAIVECFQSFAVANQANTVAIQANVKASEANCKASKANATCITALAGKFEVFGDRLSQVEVMVRNSNTNTGANSNVAAAAAAAPRVFSVGVSDNSPLPVARNLPFITGRNMSNATLSTDEMAALEDCLQSLSTSNQANSGFAVATQFKMSTIVGKVQAMNASFSDLESRVLRLERAWETFCSKQED